MSRCKGVRNSHCAFAGRWPAGGGLSDVCLPSDPKCAWRCLAGKWMCDANSTLAQEPCIVLSMGSNGQTDFETAILQRAPHCRVS
jgi:Methyltransferase domain